MEESYLEYFKSELILIRIFLTVTLICMFISFFGVYSIMNLVCERRRKEIAIRKINGAGKGGIIRLFLKDYLIITAVALVFALPLGYLFSENWLARFAVRIDIGIEYFLLCFVVIFSLIILIVVAKVLTVANVVPVNELKKN